MLTWNQTFQDHIAKMDFCFKFTIERAAGTDPHKNHVIVHGHISTVA